MSSPFAAGMPWDFVGFAAAFGPVLKRMLPRERFIDGIPVEPDSPQEDEIPLANMSPLSFYHGIYFPRAFDANFDRGIFFRLLRRPRDPALGRDLRVFLAQGLARRADADGCW